LETTVGINSWVAHRNESVFGNDVESFIPERWLASEESVRKMDRYFLEVRPRFTSAGLPLAFKLW
jgi:cytochrome P450